MIKFVIKNEDGTYWGAANTAVLDINNAKICLTPRVAQARIDTAQCRVACPLRVSIQRVLPVTSYVEAPVE